MDDYVNYLRHQSAALIFQVVFTEQNYTDEL